MINQWEMLIYDEKSIKMYAKILFFNKKTHLQVQIENSPPVRTKSPQTKQF